jgi:hypothetical protein
MHASENGNRGGDARLGDRFIRFSEEVRVPERRRPPFKKFTSLPGGSQEGAYAEAVSQEALERQQRLAAEAKERQRQGWRVPRGTDTASSELLDPEDGV